MKKRFFSIAVLLFAGFFICGCASGGGLASSDDESSSDEEYTMQLFAMDTYMTLTAYGENAEEAVEAGAEEIERLDELFSVGIDTSEVAQINESGGGEISEETAYLIELSLEVCESTSGAFDITIYPLMELWGFTTGEYSVPGDDELIDVLSKVDASALSITEDEDGSFFLSLDEGQQIDLGGIAKGYASGRVMEIFEEYGIESAIINLGGNAHVLGNKTDGSKWNIAIQDPEDKDSYIGGVSVSDAAIITSGGYERYFEDEDTGEVYHHIIDPETGYPADGGLISVTIVSENSALADALSTSLYVMGAEAAIKYCEENCEELSFEAVLGTADGDIYITDDLEDDFIDTNGDTVLNVIETGN